MSKTADNERIKLNATFYNNVAVGMTLIGIVTPYFSLLPKWREFGELVGHWMYDNAALSLQDFFHSIFLTLVVIGGSLYFARFFRGRARAELAKLTD